MYFQDELGGGSGSRRPGFPELSFDITVVELLPPDDGTLGDSA